MFAMLKKDNRFSTLCTATEQLARDYAKSNGFDYIGELPRGPQIGETIDQATGEIIPIDKTPTKEQQLQQLQDQISKENIAVIAKVLVEIRNEMVKTGKEITPIPTELTDKLASIESLTAEKPIAEVKN
jgi:hypothetical protein